jgi:hypothetical protein
MTGRGSSEERKVDHIVPMCQSLIEGPNAGKTFADRETENADKKYVLMGYTKR